MEEVQRATVAQRTAVRSHRAEEDEEGVGEEVEDGGEEEVKTKAIIKKSSLNH